MVNDFIITAEINDFGRRNRDRVKVDTGALDEIAVGSFEESDAGAALFKFNG